EKLGLGKAAPALHPLHLEGHLALGVDHDLDVLLVHGLILLPACFRPASGLLPACFRPRPPRSRPASTPRPTCERPDGSTRPLRSLPPRPSTPCLRRPA